MRSELGPRGSRRTMRARIPEYDQYPPPQRYWNEYDDGDADVNTEEVYTIYVDPNEPLFPVIQRVSKSFGVLYGGFKEWKGKMMQWLLNPKQKHLQSATETTTLISGQQANEADIESSGSYNNEFPNRPPSISKNRRTTSPESERLILLSHLPDQPLSPQQEVLENMLFRFYTGFIALAYMMLVMTGMLLCTARRKVAVEVDGRVVAGIVTAETCAVVTVILIFRRKQRLRVLHWGLVGGAVAGVGTIGVAMLGLMLADARKGALKRGGE